MQDAKQFIEAFKQKGGLYPSHNRGSTFKILLDDYLGREEWPDGSTREKRAKLLIDLQSKVQPGNVGIIKSQRFQVVNVVPKDRAKFASEWAQRGAETPHPLEVRIRFFEAKSKSLSQDYSNISAKNAINATRTIAGAAK